MEFDYVATTDIREGDEILIDYGDGWAEAWERHVENWEPTVQGAEDYVDVSELNCVDGDCAGTPRIRTMDEQVNELNPDYIHSFYHYRRQRGFALSPGGATKTHWRLNIDDWDKHGPGDSYRPCRILSRSEDDVRDKNGALYYTCELNYTEDEGYDDDDATWKDTLIVTSIPQHNIRFIKSPYTSDMYLPNAFRHEMMIPDELMPEVWKNKDV